MAEKQDQRWWFTLDVMEREYYAELSEKIYDAQNNVAWWRKEQNRIEQRGRMREKRRMAEWTKR